MGLLTQRLPFPATLIWTIVFFGFVYALNISISTNRHFVYLADSFLHGRLDFQPEHAPYLTLEKDGRRIWPDAAMWQGKYYWPLGPLPAVLLMVPVALFGTNLLQGDVQIILVAINLWLFYRLAILLKHKQTSAIYLTTAFTFASTYIGVAAFPVSWFFAQVVGTTLTLLALHEYFRTEKPNWWLIGLYLGLATATRLTLGLGAAFFIYLLLTSEAKDKLRQLIKMAIPMILVVLTLMAYNYARFQNPWESGYKLQPVHPLHEPARQVGYFSLKHLPANLYFFLLHSPQAVLIQPNSSILRYPYVLADRWGMGIFFNTPILIFLLLYHKRDKIMRAALIASGLILIPILTYYGIGASQFGYRYAVDFLPYLFVALLSLLAPEIPRAAKGVIILSSLFNIYLALHFIF